MRNYRGASLAGTVKARKGNMISIALDMDEDDGIHSEREDYFFTYAIESKDFYCMPVEGARVHLYFPSGKEWEAIAVHSLRSTTEGAQREDKTANPSTRSLSNDTGAAMELAADGILMSPDDNSAIRMKLGNDGTVEISGTDLWISGKDVNIGQSEDGDVNTANLTISAGDTLFLSRVTGDETGIIPVEDHFIGAKGVIQIYATNHIYHSTRGPGLPVNPTYDDSDLIAQEMQQAQDHNDQVANELIQRNQEARAQFGKGLLMAALGVALIVCTGGAAAAVAVGVGLCVFADANMSEATHSHELAMSGDWSTPAENYLKEVIPEPWYSLVENGLIIAGSIMFTGGVASQIASKLTQKAMAGASKELITYVSSKVGKAAGKKAVQKLLTSTAINTVGDVAFDVIPDGRFDRSFMEYLDSVSTTMMVTALTSPTWNIPGCNGRWGTFARQYAGGFAASTLYDISSGNLSWESIGEDLVREGISAAVSSRVGYTMAGKDRWLVMGVDTLTDTVIDSGAQVWESMRDPERDLSDFDWVRCLRTALTSFANNYFMACDPVNCSRGNLLIYKADLIFRGLFGEERWFRRYDSVLDYEGAFGKGWLHSFESFVLAETVPQTGKGQEDLVQYRITAMLPDTHKEVFVYREGEWLPEKEGAPYQFHVKPEGGFLLEERAEGKYTAYHYDKKGRLMALQGHPGCEPTRIFYVEKGEDIPIFTRSTIERVEYPGGQRLYFTYMDRLVTSVTDHMGRKVTYHYVDGRLDHVNYPTGGCQEYAYDEAGHITVLKGEDGREFIRNEYDDRGRVITQHYPDGTNCRMTYVDHERKTIFHYSDSGREEINYYNDKLEIVRREFGDGICEMLTYDSYGNKTSVTDRNGNTTTYKYDIHGQLIEKCSPEGLVNSYVYDDSGMILEEYDNTGAHKWYGYDRAGYLVWEREQLDENICRTISYTRDEYGRMLSVTDALGNTTEYVYEENIDKPTEVTTAEGYVFGYRYDKAGRRTKIITDYGTREICYSETDEVSMETDALGNRTRYHLDAVGNVLKTIRPNQYDEETDNGEGIYYEYDYLDRLELTRYPDGSRKQSIHDMDGNVLRENLLPVLPQDMESHATRYSYDGRRYRISEQAPDGGITYFERDRNGNLLKTIRPEEYAKSGRNGAGITHAYDKENRLTGIYDDGGDPFRRFTYDRKGRLTESVEGDASYGTRYVYDKAGRLTEKWVPVREADDILYNVTYYAYDAADNRILERRSPDEVKVGEMPLRFLDIRMYYDKQNRLVRVEDSLGAAAEYTYDCLNNRLTERYRVNESAYRFLCYKYDAAGRLIRRMESVDLTDVGLEEKPHCKKQFLYTNYTYDKNGNIIKITLPKGGEVSREYDIMDRVTSETIRDEKSGIHRTVTFTYDASGKLVSRNSSDGSVHSYTYDSCGRLISETDEEGGTTRYFHNRNSELVKAVSADNYDAGKDDGAGYSFSYDVFGRIREVRDAYGHLCEADAYDKAGRLKSRSDSAGQVFLNRYDMGGRKIAVYAAEAENPVQTYTYDSLGNITGITDGEQNHTSFELDDWGRIVTLKAPDGSCETYTYDNAGNITSTTDGRGNTISYTYNSMMKLSRVTDQVGNADTFTYDGEGNRTCHRDRNGKQIMRSYGSFGVLLEEVAEDGSYRRMKYDKEGRLVENASNHVVYRYDYTKTGKLRTKYINGKAALSYTYTAGGKVASLRDISGKLTEYAYDLNGNLSKVLEEGKILAAYEYDEVSRIRSIRFANGISTDYSYDDDRNLASLKTVDKNGNCLLSYSYGYDRNGNRVEKRDHVKENHTTYVYDSMQRLGEVIYPEAGKETYTYDAAGNRMEKRVQKLSENPTQGYAEAYTERYTYDERNRLMERTVWEHGNTEPATTAYTYDAQGSLLTEQSMDICRKYLYNDFHQCIRAEVIKGRETEAENAAHMTHKTDVQENIYDGEGLRFALIENGKGTSFITNGWENLAELDESGKVIKRIIRGNGIVASEDAADTGFAGVDNVIDATAAFGTAYHYYHGNERMDVEFITDEAGMVVNGYEYDAFGSITSSREIIQNRYTYNGEAFDKTTQQHYLRKRFYNPRLCRFTQEDEYRGDGLNLYAFCANNPVMYVDPSGYQKDCPNSEQQQKNADEGGNKENVNESGSNFGFTVDEINNLKNTVINEGQMLKDMGLTTKQLGPAIAGAYDRTTGKIYTAINDYYGNIPMELAPIIRERIENMPPEVLDSYINTKGAGSHAEIYAVNKLLLDNPNAQISDIAVYVNRTLGTSKPVVEIPFETCPHCRYILEGFNIISNN